MAAAKLLAWVDLESTGLNEHHDPILEIGLIITRISIPFDELDHYEAVILPTDPTWRDRMDNRVLRMHTINHLIEDVEERGRNLRDVEFEILSLLMKHGRPHDYMLAGSGVSHSDRRFIKAQMPGFDKWLQHPCLDVGVIRRGLRYAGRRDLDAFGQTFMDGDKPHRGLSDVRDHLNEWRQYASIFESIS